MDEPEVLRVVRQIAAVERVLRERHELHLGPAFEEMRRLEALWQEQDRAQRHLEEVARQYSFAASSRTLEAVVADYEALREVATLALDRTLSPQGTVEKLSKYYDQAAQFAGAAHEMEVIATSFASPHLEPLVQDLHQLSGLGYAVIDELARSPGAFNQPSSWILRAPVVLPYVASASVVALGDQHEASNWEFPQLDSELDGLADSIEQRLADVSRDLVAPYRGAVQALRAGGPDWQRHVGASVRMLIDALLDCLAPAHELELFFAGRADVKSKGVYTRRAQLLYIFREVDAPGYDQMVAKDVDMTLATFYPANQAVHSLVPNLSGKQGRVFLRRVEGCLLTLLATLEC